MVCPLQGLLAKGQHYGSGEQLSTLVKLQEGLAWEG